MEDRELLELAAKAVGYENAEWKEYSNAPPTMTVRYAKPIGGVTGFMWNPLGDDGHCARMEADLLLRVTFHDGWVSVGHASFGSDEFCEFFCDHEDRNAARRRASTCAAAEIGRTK